MKEENEKIKYDSFFVEGLEQDPFLYGLHYKKFYVFFAIILSSILILGFSSPLLKNLFGSLGLVIIFILYLFLLNIIYKNLRRNNPIYTSKQGKKKIIVNNKKTITIIRGIY